MKLAIALILTTTLTGCGGDVDLTGLYSVTSHRVNQTSCTVEGEAVTDPAYFRIEKDDLFGQKYFTYQECTSTDPATCSGGGLFGVLFSVAIDNGWSGQVSMSSGTGDPCSLSYGEHSAVFQDDDSLRIEIRVWGEEVTVPEADCGYEEAEARGTDMPCTHFEVVVGQPIDAT